jgi:hypothetical protein
MKILMTGMASSHCVIGENISFFNTLHSVLSEFADVTVSAPKLSWTRADLQKFDIIFLGMVPPTALSANKIYGALHVLDLMYESNKLRLVFDGQQMWQYKNSIESFKRNPNQIYSNLYVNRKDYLLATSKYANEAESVADKFSNLEWPKSYVPALPWSTAESLAKALRIAPTEKLIPVNLDSYLISDEVEVVAIRNRAWAVSDTKSSWWVKLSSTVKFPGISIKFKQKNSLLEAMKYIKHSIGLVVPPQERKVGTWWNYQYIQGLNAGTPIITNWLESSRIGDSWSILAYQVEDMDQISRDELAKSQRDSYITNIPTRLELIERLKQDLMDTNKERI